MMDDPNSTFDQYGYVKPYDVIELTWQTFVDTFSCNSHRHKILAAYEDFLTNLSELLPIAHRHWVDGSFVSQKAEPADIDIVVFVPYTHFSAIISDLKRLKNQVAGLIDCYFVEMFPRNHPKFEISRADELDWYYFLRTDRRKRPKGILEIWHNYGNK